MPTYVYACKACEHQFEKFQSFSAKALRTCPNCGEKALSKVIFPAGVVFKGSGFYINDSKGSSSTSSSNSDSNGGKSDKKDSSSGSSKKADKKPRDGGASGPSDSKKPADSKSD